MIVKIKDKEFELRYSMRGYILYENIIGKSINFDDFKNQQNLIALCYAFVISSAQYHKIDIHFTYDEFIDWIDEQGGLEFCHSFATWFFEASTAQHNLVKGIHEDSENKEENF